MAFARRTQPLELQLTATRPAVVVCVLLFIAGLVHKCAYNALPLAWSKGGFAMDPIMKLCQRLLPAIFRLGECLLQHRPMPHAPPCTPTRRRVLRHHRRDDTGATAAKHGCGCVRRSCVRLVAVGSKGESNVVLKSGIKTKRVPYGTSPEGPMGSPAAHGP